MVAFASSNAQVLRPAQIFYYYCPPRVIIVKVTKYCLSQIEVCFKTNNTAS